MSVTIDDILSLAGRLDDGPGFDAPRERFRRFLLAHVRTSAIARLLVEQCQHAPVEQHHRALQDLVILTGRFLGFETTFGVYAPLSGAVRYDGQWQSRSRLHVVVEVRWDHVAAPGVETLVRSVSAVTATSGPGVHAAGLCVVVQPHTGRNRIEEAVAAAHAGFPLGVIALQSLLALADTVSAGGASHEDVVRMIETGIPIDFVVGLIEKSQGRTTPEPLPLPLPEMAAPAAGVPDGPHFWITVVGPDHATRPEEFLELVVGRRQIFGITGTHASPHVVRPGDGLCFYIAGKGVVGHARVASLVENANIIRDAHRFRQLLHVEDVRLHIAEPRALDPESQLHMQSAAPIASRLTQTLVHISRESYRALTAFKPPARPAPQDAATGPVAVPPPEAPAAPPPHDAPAVEPDSSGKGHEHADAAPPKAPSIGASRRRR